MDSISITLDIALLGVIAIISLFCALTIFIIPIHQRAAVKLLSVYFIVLFFGYLFAVFKYVGFFTFINWDIIVLFFAYLGSFIFFYFVQKTLRKEYRLKGINLLIIVPSIFLFVLIGLDIIIPELKVFPNYLNNKYLYYFDVVYLFSLNFINLYTIYWYKKTILNTQSSYNKHEYRWISSIVYAKLLIGAIPLALSLLLRNDLIHMSKDYHYIMIDIMGVVFIFFIFYITLINAKKTMPIQIKSSYKNTKIYIKEPDQKQLDLLEEISLNFITYKTFKEPDLSIDKLARILNVKPRFLSSTINTYLNQNFYDFINSYRIKEAILIFSNKTNFSIAEVMYEVGYNSKSSFNTAFKKITGNTPSYFIKKNKNK